MNHFFLCSPTESGSSPKTSLVSLCKGGSYHCRPFDKSEFMTIRFHLRFIAECDHIPNICILYFIRLWPTIWPSNDLLFKTGFYIEMNLFRLCSWMKHLMLSTDSKLNLIHYLSIIPFSLTIFLSCLLTLLFYAAAFEGN